MFHVGQKVVCVEAGGYYAFPMIETRLRKNAIYTIRAIYQNPVLVSVEEIPGGFDDAYSPVRFRPVTERETDIEIFKRLLVPGTKIVEHVS